MVSSCCLRKLYKKAVKMVEIGGSFAIRAAQE